MAEYKEFTGKSQAEAVEKASRELSIPKEKLRYDILSHGSTGIFGLVGVKKAKIRVRIPGPSPSETKTPDPPAPQESQASEEDVPAKPPAAAKGKGRRQGSSQRRGRPKKSTKQEPAEEQAADAPAPVPDSPEPVSEHSALEEAAPAAQPDAAPDPGTPELQADPASDKQEPAPAHHRQRQPLASDEELSEASRKVEQDIRFLCGYLLDDFTVTAGPAPGGHVLCKVEAPDTGLLIGRKGQTLESVQHLLEMMINRGREKKVRVRVDAGGYMARREDNLARMAQRLAEKVKRSGRPFSFSPMSAYDRRIVHLALKEEKDIRTISKGTGSLRKLIIIPRAMASKKLPADFDAPVAHDEEEDLS
ncbi:MAG: RNA-binding cell elongation regulator Jag/EloR [Thermodesulfobacteriota bacterium]